MSIVQFRTAGPEPTLAENSPSSSSAQHSSQVLGQESSRALLKHPVGSALSLSVSRLPNLWAAPAGGQGLGGGPAGRCVGRSGHSPIAQT